MDPKTDISKRKGTVRFSIAVFQKDLTIENLKVIFENFFPVAITMENYLSGDLTYHGYSPHFREVEDGVQPPTYQMWFKKDEAGNVSFERVEEVIK